MSKDIKPGLGFSADAVVAIHAPVKATEQHKPHERDALIIELNEDDTASIYLEEVDAASGRIIMTRTSMNFPISMLADLVRRRPMTAAEHEEFALAEAADDYEIVD